MTEHQYHKIYKKHLKMMPKHVKEIVGTNLPDLPMCNNVIYYAGRSIALQGMLSLRGDENYQHASDDLRACVYNKLAALNEEKDESFPPDTPLKVLKEAAENKRKEIYAVLHEEMEQAYYRTLREGMRLGCVRIPVVMSRADENATVTSKYGPWEINYSPMMTSIPELRDDLLMAIAKFFTKAMILEEPASVISVYFGKELSYKEYVQTHDVMKSFLVLTNQYLKAEFEAKKDDDEYRHRDDDDPALF